MSEGIITEKEWESYGFQVSEEGEVVLGNFSLTIDFDGILDTKVLKDAAAGLDAVVSSGVQLFSRIIGQNVVPGPTQINLVEAGSCTFKDIRLGIKDVKKLAETIRKMNKFKLFLICMTCLGSYTVYKFAAYKEAQLQAENSASTHIDNSIHFENAKIQIRDSLNARFPDSQAEVDTVISELETMHKEAPMTMRRYAKGLTNLAHPGGVEATGITTGVRQGEQQEVTQDLISPDQMKDIPREMPPREPAQQTQEFYPDVQIEVVKIDTESRADSALMCRILDEGYSSKKCPLIIHDAALKATVLQLFPKPMNVSLYALMRDTGSGDPAIVGYVLKSILD